jgi:hypothetical protein
LLLGSRFKSYAITSSLSEGIVSTLSHSSVHVIVSTLFTSSYFIDSAAFLLSLSLKEKYNYLKFKSFTCYRKYRECLRYLRIYVKEIGWFISTLVSFTLPLPLAFLSSSTQLHLHPLICLKKLFHYLKLCLYSRESYLYIVWYEEKQFGSTQ